MLDCVFVHVLNADMAVDPSLLSGGTGLVKSHEVSGDMEKTNMRSAQDAKDLHQFQTNLEMGCDAQKHQNVMQNIFGYRARKNTYKNT